MRQAAAAFLLVGLSACAEAGNSQNDIALAPPEEAGDLNLALGGDEISPIPEGEDLAANAAVANGIVLPVADGAPPPPRPGGSGAARPMAPAAGPPPSPLAPPPPAPAPGDGGGMRPPRVPSDDTPPGQRNNPPPPREP